MSYSLVDLEAMAAEQFRGLDVDDADGKRLFTLRSVIRLTEAEQEKLKSAQSQLEESQGAEDQDVAAIRAHIVALLSILADKPQALRTFVKPRDLGIVMALLTQYNKDTQSAEGN